ncbi:MAG: YXWGXW repeat-containing protein [Bryobacteraceae bacterium]
MLRKLFLIPVLGVFLSIGAANAQVYVGVAPPRPVIEHRGPAPGAGYVWIPGYHRWDGHAHVWVAGYWQLPPRPHAHWVAARWAHRPGGWVLIEGHWR